MNSPTLPLTRPMAMSESDPVPPAAPLVSYQGRVKYNPARSLEYQSQDPRKNRAEMALIEKAFSRIPKVHRVLDVPCGGGRATIKLAKDGYAVSAGDLSPSMRRIAAGNIDAAGLNCPVLRLDLENLQLEDQSVDTTLCFRLFHHFPNADIRRQAVSELCRVSRRYVVLSYLSIWAYTSLVRTIRKTITGKRGAKFCNSLSEVTGYFHESGFRLVKDYARFPLIHTLHLAVFERIESI